MYAIYRISAEWSLSSAQSVRLNRRSGVVVPLLNTFTYFGFGNFAAWLHVVPKSGFMSKNANPNSLLDRQWEQRFCTSKKKGKRKVRKIHSIESGYIGISRPIASTMKKNKQLISLNGTSENPWISSVHRNASIWNCPCTVPTILITHEMDGSCLRIE